MSRGTKSFTRGAGAGGGFRKVSRGETFIRSGVEVARLVPPSGTRLARFAGPAGELKFHDVDLDDSTISAGMTIRNLTVIPTGVGESQRVGRKITIRNIQIKGRVRLDSHSFAVNSSDTVVFMLVQDTQTNGVQFAPADLLDTNTFDSFRKLSEESRFKILYWKQYDISSGGFTEFEGVFDTLEYVKGVKLNIAVNIPVEYNNSASTGAIATVRSNNIYWTAQSEGSDCSAVLTCRLRFSDL